MSTPELRPSSPGAHFADNDCSFTTLSCEDVSLRHVHMQGFIRGAIIGHGSFGTVYESFDKAKRRCVAMKVYSGDRKTSLASLQNNARPIRAVSQAQREVDVLRAVRPSPFLIEYVTDFVSVSGQRTLVTGIVRGCNLHNLVLQATAKGVLLPVLQTRHVLWSLLSGLAFLKSEGYLHNDVKPENVLVSETHEVRLSDFGSAFHVSSLDSVELSQELSAQSPAFQPPEVAQGLPLVDCWSADVWSCGIVMYLMVSGHYPFDMQRMSLLDVLEKVSRAAYEPCDDYSGLIEHLLVPESRRLTLEQARQHEFVAKYRGFEELDTALSRNAAAAGLPLLRTAPASVDLKMEASSARTPALAPSVSERKGLSLDSRMPNAVKRRATGLIGGASSGVPVVEGWFDAIAPKLSFVDGVHNGGTSVDDGEEIEATDYDSAMMSMSREGSLGQTATAAPAKEHQQQQLVDGAQRTAGCCTIL